jgi:hypothetical protein
LQVLKVGTDAALETTFVRAHELGLSGLAISGGDPFFVSRNEQLASLAARHRVPAVGAGPRLLSEPAASSAMAATSSTLTV